MVRVSRKRPDLFDDALEDDLAGRPVSAKQRVGGAALRADEFAPAQGPEELDARFSLLQREEHAMRLQRDRERLRRVRWTGTLWLTGGFAALGLAVLGWTLVQRAQARSAQAAMVRAEAARKRADQERIMRLQDVAPAPQPPPPAH